MLDSKLAKIRDLIAQKEKIDTELAQLLGDQPVVKRGRKPRATIQEVQPEE